MPKSLCYHGGDRSPNPIDLHQQKNEGYPLPNPAILLSLKQMFSLQSPQKKNSKKKENPKKLVLLHLTLALTYQTHFQIVRDKNLKWGERERKKDEINNTKQAE
ncbi:hypothetical protein AVEN_186335-1 [Araneus ventricosus]|uniref:Uncharacterized protein n=1 Tax=Araneus ventricosus TaxID=182803 RepID=A0A4Y2QG65_ARAVE|nr:hypothetical protein AVEN_186335-1 [Araneus ventricosus]